MEGASSSRTPPPQRSKQDLVRALLAAKTLSGKSLNQIAAEVRITNAYLGQLLLRQTPLASDRTASRLAQAVPGLTPDLIAAMRVIPERLNAAGAAVFDEPTARRLHEIVGHYASTVKMLVDEELGDGVMSAEDFWVKLDMVKGLKGEDRVLIIFDGRFMPVAEQVYLGSVADAESLRSASAVPGVESVAGASGRGTASVGLASSRPNGSSGGGDGSGGGGGGERRRRHPVWAPGRRPAAAIVPRHTWRRGAIVCADRQPRPRRYGPVVSLPPRALLEPLVVGVHDKLPDAAPWAHVAGVGGRHLSPAQPRAADASSFGGGRGGGRRRVRRHGRIPRRRVGAGAPRGRGG